MNLCSLFRISEKNVNVSFIFSALFSVKLIHFKLKLSMVFQEICQRPKFIAEGATRFDVEQGENGDPWLLAAVSSLTLTPRFLDRSAH